MKVKVKENPQRIKEVEFSVEEEGILTIKLIGERIDYFSFPDQDDCLSFMLFGKLNYGKYLKFFNLKEKEERKWNI